MTLYYVKCVFFLSLSSAFITCNNNMSNILKYRVHAFEMSALKKKGLM